MPKNINVKKEESNQNNFPWLNSARGKDLNNSLTNENHQALLKQKLMNTIVKKRIAIKTIPHG
jgi:hypothetical protein